MVWVCYLLSQLCDDKSWWCRCQRCSGSSLAPGITFPDIIMTLKLPPVPTLISGMVTVKCRDNVSSVVTTDHWPLGTCLLCPGCTILHSPHYHVFVCSDNFTPHTSTQTTAAPGNMRTSSVRTFISISSSDQLNLCFLLVNLFLSWGDSLLLITALTPLYFLEVVCWDLTVSGVWIKDGDNRQHPPIPELSSNTGLGAATTLPRSKPVKQSFVTHRLDRW